MNAAGAVTVVTMERLNELARKRFGAESYVYCDDEGYTLMPGGEFLGETLEESASALLDGEV